MDAGGWAHFDTYFNGFFINKWKKYTNLDKINLNISIKGHVRITILHKERNDSGICTNKKINEIEINASDKETVTIPINQDSNQGMYTFSIYAISNGCYFYDGNYSTAAEDSPRNDVKIGICICTFKREQFVLKNIDTLKKNFLENEGSPLFDRLKVFISDNAGTLNLESDENIKYYKNKNAGGAGGFTRCLIEILDKPDLQISHALLMDDDIVFDPESIYRTYSVLSMLKEEYIDAFVGGAMLRLDTQSIQTEQGAVWNSGRLKSLKNGLDLAACESCLFNDIEETCEYNAWWYCATPIRYVRPDNLPLPIFIRGDDVEYGLRNTKYLIHINGVCVWHEPFEYKYSSAMYYYIFRNRLIDNSVRSVEYPMKQLFSDFNEQWQNEMKMYRYKNAGLLVRGIEDFLKGVDWLKETDAEELHKEMTGLGYKMIPIEETGFSFTYDDYQRSINNSWQDRGKLDKVKKKAGNNLSKNTDIVCPTFNANPDLFYRVDRALNYDYSSKKGFVTQKDTEQERIEKKRYDRLLKDLKDGYRTVCEEYRSRSDELTSLEFWSDYLSL
jgi:hypothetical protein